MKTISRTALLFLIAFFIGAMPAHAAIGDLCEGGMEVGDGRCATYDEINANLDICSGALIESLGNIGLNIPFYEEGPSESIGEKCVTFSSILSGEYTYGPLDACDTGFGVQGDGEYGCPSEYQVAAANYTLDNGSLPEGLVEAAKIDNGEVQVGIAGKVVNFYKWALGIAALIALGIIIYGGVTYIMSSGNPSRIDDAKRWIWAALGGLLLLFGAFLILNTINPNLTNLQSIFLAVNPEQELPTYPTIEIPVDDIVPVADVAGTYSCVWNEDAGPGYQCKPTSSCNGGFEPGNCSIQAEKDACESVQDYICEWVGGVAYDGFAAVAKSYAVPPPRVRGVNPVEDSRHQAYVSASPLSEKDASYPDCLGADCGVFVATVVRNTIDPNFPVRGTANIRSYLENNPMYELVEVNSYTELRPGDILMPYKTAYGAHSAYCQVRRDGTHMPCGTGHVAIWLDDGEYEAAFSSSPEACGYGEYLPKSKGAWKTHMGNAFRYVGF